MDNSNPADQSERLSSYRRVSMRRQRFALILFCIFIVSASYTYFAASDCIRQVDVCFGTNSPIPPSEYAPFKYRLLEPALLRVVNPDDTQQGAILGAVVLFGLLTAAILPMLYLWLKRYLTEDKALIGVMVYSLTNIAAMHLWYLTLSTPLEVCFVLLTLLLVESKWWVIAPIVVISSFNRETTLILPALYLAWHWPQRWRGGVILVAIYAAITAGLHLILGSAEHVNGSLAGMLAFNISNAADAGFCFLILSPLYWLIWKGYRAAPEQIKRLSWLGIAYLGAAWVGGNAGESMRYILVPLPVFLILALASPASRLTPAAPTA